MAYIKPTQLTITGQGLTQSSSPTTGFSPITLSVNTATTSTLGVVKAGDGLSITSEGVLNVTGGAGGYTGSQGYSGSRGYSGSQGNQGNIGFTGSAGPSGGQGSAGVTGSVGYSGSKGDIGFTGSLGYAGSKGDTGFVGSVGYSGSKGDIGFTGSKGDSGYDGSQGNQGYTGSAGIGGAGIGVWDEDLFVGTFTNLNFVGLAVVASTQSVNHAAITISAGGGYSGSQGDSGYSGSRGDIGYTGSFGYAGSQGDIGYVGSAGTNGFTGSQGNLGYTGSQGSSGFTGSAGTNGFTGSKGDSGLGFTIAKSYLSVAALTSDTSPTGITAGQFAVIETGNVNDIENSKLYLWSGSAYSYVSDLSGAQGITGPQGDPGVGYTGSQGDIGYTGSAGSNGFTGSQGNLGYTGSAGSNGFTGSAGTNGFTGSLGYVGSRGNTGGTEFVFQNVGFNYSVDGFADSTYPTLTVVRGQLYYFNLTNITNSHPLALRLTSGDTSAVPGTNGNNASSGVYGNGTTPTVVTYQVPFDAPSTIFYQCIVHSGMIGTINIVDQYGYTGSAGTNGFTGSAGTNGFTGSAGTGFTGSAGSLGYTGSRGVDGVSTTTTIAAVTTIVGTTSTTAGIPGFADRSYTGALNDAYTLSNGDLYVWKGGDTAGSTSTSIEYLIVAGGGAGAYGGGGAGGVLTTSGYVVASGSPVSLSVGAGGTNSNGSDSTFGSFTAIGGGRGGSTRASAGASGGSGGGASFDYGNAAAGGGAGTAGQGNRGGHGSSGGGDASAGGGGGAGGVGTGGYANGTNLATGSTGAGGGAGGIGVLSSISGTSTYYGGGGGGGANVNGGNIGNAAPGGQGGGGAGSTTASGTTQAGTNGTPNTGGGGGGGDPEVATSSFTSGGSGIVIIRYADTYPAASATTGSPTTVTTGGYRIYSWTTVGSGSITFASGAPITGQGWILVGNIKGTPGEAAAIGYTGSAGAGYTGSVGFTGSAGTGFTGSAGTNGFTGSAGVGFTGSAGTGYTGSAGVGFTGSAGTGFTGSAGTNGYTGSKGESSFTYGPTAPISPTVGDRWYDSVEGAELVYTNDGNTSQWIEIAASGFLGQSGYTGSAGFGSSGPKISSVTVTDSSYNNLDDTAVALAGGYIKIAGSGFESGCQVLLGTTLATSVSYVSSTEVRAQLPAASTGTYIIYLVNTDGGTAIRVNAVTFSATPAWTTGASLAGASDTAISIQLAATDATSYSVAAGSSLPSGITLSSGGLLSGTITGLSQDTTYNFTIIATDAELQDSTRAFTFSITVGEPYFKYVSLLLPGNGTNNATNNTFVDSSTNNFTITRNGNITQGTFSPYGNNWSYFNSGASSYLNFGNQTALHLGSGDFTIEMWLWKNADTTYMTACGDFATASSNTFQILSDVNGTKLGVYSGASNSFVITSVSSIPINTWTHIALVRSSTTLTLYINGVSDVSATYATNLNASTSFFIGHTPELNAGRYWNGNISNFRMVKGTAVYTGAFTPSTTPLTSISGTVLLTCQSNRFIDNSSNAFAVTVSGSPAIQRFSPFSPPTPYSTSTIGGSAYFDGSDSLSAAYTGDPTGNFTIEFWWYPTTLDPNYQEVFTKSAGIQIFTISSTINAAFSSNNSTSYYLNGSFGTLIVNSWNHIVVVKNGTSYTGYLNGIGTSLGTSSDVPATGGNPVSIGYYAPANTYYTTGYISDARYVVGTAVYTSNFTPTTSPLTAIANTQLLCNFTNASIIDNSMMNNLETVGDAKISTTQTKFGSGSLYFDGTGDVLKSTPSTINILSNGDFTIEFWLYPSNTSSAYRALVSSENYPSTTGGWSLYQNGTSIEFWISSGGSATINATSVITTNTWQHLALCRASGTLRLFKNGTSISSVSNSTSLTGQQIWIGDNNSNGGGLYFYNGYIDDLRFTRGYARYTSTFTPPTSAHPLK